MVNDLRTGAARPDGPLRAAVELLEDLAAVSSATGDAAGLGRAAAIYGAALAARGLAVEIQTMAGAGGDEPVLFARGPATGERHLLVLGHLDTVLPARPPRRDGERLWGSGTVDMKGGLAAVAGALDLLRATGREVIPDLLLAALPDEEIVGPLTRRLTAELGGRARGLLVLEPGQRRNGVETVVIGRRGMLHWRLEARGRSAHAGSAYWQGRSALVAAAAFCVGARALARPGPGPTVNAGRLIAGDAGFVDDLAAGSRLLGSSRRINVVPDRALVEGEARFATLVDGEVLRRDLEALAETVAAEHEVALELEVSPLIPPLEPSAASRAWVGTAAGLARRHGFELEAEEDRRGLSFPNFLPDPSAIPILDGLGPAGGGAHTREEWVDLVSLERRVALLADLLANPPPAA
ncbi:MAG: M20/M25/M40 family metallo-hydrolase [Acidobacteria bacterium]|nr:MAG: M20/M25/M40 family metallo-hydrolase [Acidobacteriota bacterium]